MSRLVFGLAGMAVLLLSLSSWAGCGGNVGVRVGDTVSSIAQDCNINVETLKQANPGLSERTLRSGTYVQVPSAPLPSQRAYGGNRGISSPPGRIISPHFGTAQSRASIRRQPKVQPKVDSR